MDSVHRDSRTIFITGEIDDGMFETRRAINDLAYEHTRDSIILVINSGGGSVTGALAVVDAMDRARLNCELTFTGVVEGVAESAALTILQGCDRRFAGRCSLLMAHGSHGGIQGGDMHELRAYERYRVILHEHMARLYARRTPQHTVGYWLDRFESDLEAYLTPSEAREIGLIDEIAGM